MRMFFHVNEFDQYGYNALPLLIYMFDKLVVWSPISEMLDRGDTFINSRGLLELIDRGNIQIAGREFWFSRSRSAVPFTKFDEELMLLHKKSNCCNKRDTPIFLVAEESGSKWATKIVSSPSSKHKNIVKKAKLYLNDLDRIPKGVRDRIAKTETADAKLLMLLQLAKNTIRAVEETECDNTICWNEDIRDFEFIVDEKITVPQSAFGQIDAYKYRQMLDYLVSVAEIKDFKSFAKELEKKDAVQVRDEISRILSSSHSVPTEYFRWTNDSLSQKSKLDRDSKMTKLASAFVFLSALVMAVDFALNGYNPFGATLSGIGSAGTLIGVPFATHDCISFVTSRKKLKRNTPVLPFIGGRIFNNDKKEYLNALKEKTKELIIN